MQTREKLSFVDPILNRTIKMCLLLTQLPFSYKRMPLVTLFLAGQWKPPFSDPYSVQANEKPSFVDSVLSRPMKSFFLMTPILCRPMKSLLVVGILACGLLASLSHAGSSGTKCFSSSQKIVYLNSSTARIAKLSFIVPQTLT